MELGREEPHFGDELPLLLLNRLAVGGADYRVEEDDRLRDPSPILGAAEAPDIDTDIARERRIWNTEVSGRIRESCAVHVKVQTMTAGCSRDLPELIGR